MMQSDANLNIASTLTVPSGHWRLGSGPRVGRVLPLHFLHQITEITKFHGNFEKMRRAAFTPCLDILYTAS